MWLPTWLGGWGKKVIASEDTIDEVLTLMTEISKITINLEKVTEFKFPDILGHSELTIKRVVGGYVRFMFSIASPDFNRGLSVTLHGVYCKGIPEIDGTTISKLDPYDRARLQKWFKVALRNALLEMKKQNNQETLVPACELEVNPDQESCAEFLSQLSPTVFLDTIGRIQLMNAKLQLLIKNKSDKFKDVVHFEGIDVTVWVDPITTNSPIPSFAVYLKEYKAIGGWFGQGSSLDFTLYNKAKIKDSTDDLFKLLNKVLDSLLNEINNRQGTEQMPVNDQPKPLHVTAESAARRPMPGTAYGTTLFALESFIKSLPPEIIKKYWSDAPYGLETTTPLSTVIEELQWVGKRWGVFEHSLICIAQGKTLPELEAILEERGGLLNYLLNAGDDKSPTNEEIIALCKRSNDPKFSDNIVIPVPSDYAGGDPLYLIAEATRVIKQWEERYKTKAVKDNKEPDLILYQEVGDTYRQFVNPDWFGWAERNADPRTWDILSLVSKIAIEQYSNYDPNELVIKLVPVDSHRWSGVQNWTWHEVIVEHRTVLKPQKPE